MEFLKYGKINFSTFVDAAAREASSGQYEGEIVIQLDNQTAWSWKTGTGWIGINTAGNIDPTSVDINYLGSGDRTSTLNFYPSDSGIGASIVRNSEVNGNLTITNNGAGNLVLETPSGKLSVPDAVDPSHAIYIGGDANLYRSGSNVLKTDDAFEAKSLKVIEGTTPTNSLTFGTDTNLYRSATNTLKTDDTFEVGGDLKVTGGDINIGTTCNLYEAGANTLKTDDSLQIAGSHLSVIGGQIYMSALQAGAGTYPVKYNTGSGEFSYDTSSRRYKMNIMEREDYDLQTIKQLKVFRYEEINDPGTVRVGFMAEDLYPIIPDFVPLRDNLPEAVSYDRLSIYLININKQMLEKIEALEAENIELKSRLDRIEEALGL